MDIAIVGATFELQDTDTFDKLWRNLYDGKVISYYSCHDEEQSRFTLNNYDLDKIKKFPDKLFKYTSEQIKKMDPQHRRLLVLTHKLLNTYNLTHIGNDVNNTGVYTAVGTSHYLLHNLLASEENVDYTTYINNVSDTAATKISYNFNFHGPSVNISTACSSASLALEQAVKDLMLGRVDCSIVGTSRLPTENSISYRYRKDGIFSKTGLCAPFDKSSAGMVPGFGSIVLALKRKTDAERDGDSILAVIKAIGISNDGSEKSSYTAPSVSGQCRAIMAAYDSCELAPSDIDYLETHGTGTAIGDAIEFESISEIFDCSLNIGSAKANYGHLDNGSSFLSILKAILMFENQVMPKQANFSEKHPFLNNDRIMINKSSQEAPINNLAINSFGIGGTNAHIILQRYNSDFKVSKVITSAITETGPYWIEPLKSRNDVRKNRGSIIASSGADIAQFISEYLGEDISFVQKTISEIDLESYTLLDLIDAIENKFHIMLDMSDFQEIDKPLIECILGKLNESDTSNAFNEVLHPLGTFIKGRKTLFLIHPAGGTINGYSNFFKDINSNYNIIFISFPFANLKFVKLFSLRQLASYYKECISDFLKKNPSEYIIGGYSFGGNVAFEIAHQIQVERNSDVPDVIMIDSHPVEAYNESTKKHLTDNDIQDAIHEFVKQGVVGKELADENVKKYGLIWRLNHDMLKGYTAPSEMLQSHLYIFICKEAENLDLLQKLDIQYLDKTLWQKRFADKIHVNYVDGNHYSIYADSQLGMPIGMEIDRIMNEVPYGSE